MTPSPPLTVNRLPFTVRCPLSVYSELVTENTLLTANRQLLSGATKGATCG